MITLTGKIAVMQAFNVGKKIELTRIGESNWERTDCPVWNWGEFDYRVKSEPVEKWVVIDRDGDAESAWNSEPEANAQVAFLGNGAGSFAPHRVVRVREVIE